MSKKTLGLLLQLLAPILIVAVVFLLGSSTVNNGIDNVEIFYLSMLLAIILFGVGGTLFVNWIAIIIAMLLVVMSAFLLLFGNIDSTSDIERSLNIIFSASSLIINSILVFVWIYLGKKKNG